VAAKKWSSLVLMQIFGAIFRSQKILGAILTRFSEILPRYLGILFGFSGILPEFSRIFSGFSTNQNFWGCACTPCTPASYTTAFTVHGISKKYFH